MLSILSDSQKAVVDTITMKLKLPHALEYMQHVGHKMSERTYYRQKKQIEELKHDRMHFIAKVAYEEQHLERLDRMELVESLMWLDYHKEKDPLKRVKILTHIVNIQPFISSYYEATKTLVEELDFKLKEQFSHPNPLEGKTNVVMDNDSESNWT